MSSPPERDDEKVEPPFRGIVVTLLDALIVFEASRRGLIPRITRRLAEKEQAGMISSGSVFVFDEGESGIKRWTDGRIWSPSRIMSNFLVYRETDKRANRLNPLPAGPKLPQGAAKPKPRKCPSSAATDGTSATNGHVPSSSSSIRPQPAKLEPECPSGSFSLPLGAQGQFGCWPSARNHVGGSGGGDSLNMDFGELASGAVSETKLKAPTNLGQQELVDEAEEAEEARQSAGMSEKARERQLVGSLINTYRFKENGLIKKTISVTINGISQHLVSYYSMEDALSGRLRSPSTVPELFALNISPDYLSNKHFRFPPKVEIGHDGVHRYRRESDDPQSPPLKAMSMESSSSPSIRAPTSKAKRDTESSQAARRGSKASTSSGGHNVGGPSTDTWQRSTPQSWSGRPGSPMRQSARPIRPAVMQRRASEQVDYPSSIVSPLGNDDQQQLQDRQLQHQHKQGLQGYAMAGLSGHRHQSPSAPTLSSFQPPSTFQHEMQYHSLQPQMYASPTYPETMTSVLDRPVVEPRLQSLAVGTKRTSSSEDAQYEVLPGISPIQSSRNMRNFYPHTSTANDGLGGGDEQMQYTQRTRRNFDFPIAHRGSPPHLLAGLLVQAGQISPPEETPPLEAEADYTQYSHTPSFEFHSQPSTPINDQHPPHHPHSYHHPQYQLLQGPSSYFQIGVKSCPSMHPPPSAPEGYSTQPHPHQSTYAYPSQDQQPLYYDPNGQGLPQQAFDPYGRPIQPTTMDYAFQYVQHHAIDEDRRYASGMVAGGSGATAVSSQVKEEVGQEEEGYAWGFAG